MNTSQLDLNLLAVFDALMSERSVTRASLRIGRSQPAVSNSLKRMRAMFRDRLFVPGPRGVEPTPFALELAGPVSAALRMLEATLDKASFDPSTASRTFRIASSDQAAVVVLPQVFAAVAECAPNVDLQIEPKALPTVPGMLDSNQIDMAIGVFEEVPERFSAITLYQDQYVCMMPRDHPLADGELELSRFASSKHISVRAVAPATAQVDAVLQERGTPRRIVLTTNQLLSLPELVSNTGFVAAVFERTLEKLPQLNAFNVIARPLPIDPIDIKLVWHSDFTHHEPHKWVRGFFLRAMQ